MRVRTTSGMKYAFIQAEAGRYPVCVMCGVLEVSTSGYYAWRDRQPSQRAQTNQALLLEIRTIHAQSRETYGSHSTGVATARLVL